jgi:PhnB protein
MFKVHPYLNFDGNCEVAFNFYKSVFGGAFSSVMRFKQLPPSEHQVPASEGEKIMHMSLPIGESTILMGSDISQGMGQKLSNGNSVYISLQPDNTAEARKLYEGLSSGGTIEMPLGKMFWGDWFASFRDKFGIQWMINCVDK